MGYGAVHIPAGSVMRIGDDTASMMSLGVLDGDSQVEVSYDLVEYVGSQSEDVLKYIKNPKANMSATLIQLYLPNIAELLDGVATVSTVAGILVEDYEQTIAAGWTADRLYRLDGQNATGAAPTINSVEASTSGVGAADDDYVLVKGSDGDWYIALRTGGAETYATSETITIDYNYTPAESKTLKMGAKSASLTSKIVELEKTIDGSIFRVRLWAAVNQNGLTIAFPASANDNPATLPVQITGSLDTSKASGEQLLEIYDEIGLSMTT